MATQKRTASALAPAATPNATVKPVAVKPRSRRGPAPSTGHNAATGDQAVNLSKSLSFAVAENLLVQVGKKLLLEVADSLEVCVGDASLMLKKDGTVVLKGKNITIDGSGKINIKAAGDVTIKGSKIGQN